MREIVHLLAATFQVFVCFHFAQLLFLPDLIGKTEYAGKQANLLRARANNFQTTYTDNSTATCGFMQR